MHTKAFASEAHFDSPLLSSSSYQPIQIVQGPWNSELVPEAHLHEREGEYT